MPTEIRMVQQAYKFMLEPTPRQARMFARHAWAARYAYNWALAQYEAALKAREDEKRNGGTPTTPSPDHFGLCKQWTVFKDTVDACRCCGLTLTLDEDGRWVTSTAGAADRLTRAQEGLARAQERLAAAVTEIERRRAERAVASLTAKVTKAAGSLARARRLAPDCRETIWTEPGHEHPGHVHVVGLPWASQNFVGTYQAAIGHAAGAWQKYWASLGGERKGRQLGRPKFKDRALSFQVHGDSLRITSTVTRPANTRGRRRKLVTQAGMRVAIPKTGAVTVMSDDSRHPVMRHLATRTKRALAAAECEAAELGQRAAAGDEVAARAFPAARAAAEDARRDHEAFTRPVGNRRRAATLQRLLRDADTKASFLAATLPELHAASGLTTETVVDTLNRMANATARAGAVTRASAALATVKASLSEAEKTAANATTERAQAKAQTRVERIQGRMAGVRERLAKAQEITAGRTSRWSDRKLGEVLYTGRANPSQVGMLCDAYWGTGDNTAKWARVLLQRAIRQERAEPPASSVAPNEGQTADLNAIPADIFQAGQHLAEHVWSSAGAAETFKRFKYLLQRMVLRERLLDAAQQARIIRGTVSLSAGNLWEISLTADVPLQIRTEPTRRQREGGLAGVDFGTREIVTPSSGPAIPAPRYLDAALAKLAATQRALARAQPGSANWLELRAKVSVLHAVVTRLREDALHRATSHLVRQYETIAVEGWDVKETARQGNRAHELSNVDDSRRVADCTVCGPAVPITVRETRNAKGRMVTARKCAAAVPVQVRRARNRALADTSIGAGRAMLGYKGPRAGATIIELEPGEPTGRTCSECGHVRWEPIPIGWEDFVCDWIRDPVTGDRAVSPHPGFRLPRRVNSARVVAKRATINPSPAEGP